MALRGSLLLAISALMLRSSDRVGLAQSELNIRSEMGGRDVDRFFDVQTRRETLG